MSASPQALSDILRARMRSSDPRCCSSRSSSCVFAIDVGAQARTGEAIYRDACLTCHGEDGTGGPPERLGNVDPPDFSDCAFATAEPDPDWQAVVHQGGPVRALDRHMPAFGDALSAEEIALVVSHLRTFCTEPRWPRGDLNLPRAFFTEKAFPENETVWTTSLRRTRDGTAIGNELVYERRIGAQEPGRGHGADSMS